MVSNKLEKESLFVGTKDGRPWSSFMFPNGHNIKWIQLQSKHGICPKLGALGKYFQLISMNKSIANWNYLFVGIKQGLIQQSTSTSSQSYSHSKDRFFNKKKIIMNKSSSLLLHLYLHLLHFLIMNKSSYFTKKKSPIKIFNSLKKFKISKLKKKKKFNNFNSFEKFKF